MIEGFKRNFFLKFLSKNITQLTLTSKANI